MTKPSDLSNPQQNGQSVPEGSAPARHPDMSVWLIWAGLVLAAIAILPFAVRNNEVVRALARMCGFDLG